MGVDGTSTTAGGAHLLSLASRDPSLSHPTPRHRRRPLRRIPASSIGAQHDPMLPSLRAFILSVQIRRAWALPSPAARVSGDPNSGVAPVTHPRGAGEGGAHLASHKGPALLLFFLTICTTTVPGWYSIEFNMSERVGDQPLCPSGFLVPCTLPTWLDLATSPVQRTDAMVARRSWQCASSSTPS